MTEYLQVVTTISSAEEAQRLAELLIADRLAACVQVHGPIQSIYRWQGAIERSNEWCVVVKTRLDLYRDVEQAIATAHPFDVPEILAFPIVAGHPAYLDWLHKELLPPGPSP